MRTVLRGWLLHLVSAPNQQPSPGDEHDDQVVLTRAFLDQARDVAQWDRARIDAFERKAGVLMSAAIVAFTLLPGLTGQLRRLEESALYFGLLTGAAAALAVTALSSAVCLSVRRSTYINVDQLASEWRVLLGEQDPNPDLPELTPATALALSVRAMLEGQTDVPGRWRLTRWLRRRRRMSVLRSLRAVANFKANWYTVAVGASFVAVALTGIVVGRILIEGVVRG